MAPRSAPTRSGARDKLGWSRAAFEIPADVRDALARRRRSARRARRRLAPAPGGARQPTSAPSSSGASRGELPQDKLAAAVRGVKEKLAAAPKEIATRVASEIALEALTAAVPEMIGGSADLTGSNNTQPKGMTVLSAADYAGRFIHYGVREHGMAAAMNGMALHGGIIPYSGTFLVFSDYCRPAIRLAALMGERVIHVMTHDSIGLGEDGPTHQPVEHLAALRAIPNLLVFRPCDAVETVECWQLALEAAADAERAGADAAEPAAAAARPSTRRTAAPPAPTRSSPAERRGARCRCSPRGSEVVDRGRGARSSCASSGVAARVVSVPCFELFLALPDAERARGDRRRAGEASRSRPPSARAGTRSSAPTAPSSA